MTFYLLMRQRGEGCDYTIGCGKTWTALNAKTATEAEAEARQLLKDEYTDERELASATLLSVGEVTRLDVDAVYVELNRERAAKVNEQREQREREEFERLKRKYS